MKKIILSLVIVLGIILLTGCGKVDFSKTKHLECNKTENNINDTTSTTMLLSYDKNGKINDFRIDTSIIYTKTMSKEALELTAKTLKLIGKIPGISFESEVGDNSLHYSFTGNIGLLKTVMKQLNKNYDESKVVGTTKSEALTELSKDGYTCQDITN